jgi:hypothetical protein
VTWSAYSAAYSLCSCACKCHRVVFVLCPQAVLPGCTPSDLSERRLSPSPLSVPVWRGDSVRTIKHYIIYRRSCVQSCHCHVSLPNHSVCSPILVMLVVFHRVSLCQENALSTMNQNTHPYTHTHTASPCCLSLTRPTRGPSG